MLRHRELVGLEPHYHGHVDTQEISFPNSGLTSIHESYPMVPQLMTFGNMTTRADGRFLELHWYDLPRKIKILFSARGLDFDREGDWEYAISHWNSTTSFKVSLAFGASALIQFGLKSDTTIADIIPED